MYCICSINLIADLSIVEMLEFRLKWSLRKTKHQITCNASRTFLLKTDKFQFGHDCFQLIYVVLLPRLDCAAPTSHRPVCHRAQS